MEEFSLWEYVLAGIIAAGVLFFWGPGTRQRLKDSPKGSPQDWMTAVLPIGAVVLFVVFLIMIS